MFSTLVFRDHVIQGAKIATFTFPNDWTVSVVSGKKDSGLYGILGEGTYEVAVINPNNNMLDDVIPWQNVDQINTIMRLVSML